MNASSARKWSLPLMRVATQALALAAAFPAQAQQDTVPRTRTLPGIAAPLFPYAQPEEVGLSSAKLERLGQELVSWVAAGDVVGGELLIVKDGRAVFHEAYGWSNRETRKPVERNSIWSIQSMSKPFTATAVLMLAEEGKLSLDDPVSRYIPAFAGDPRTTIRHLLSHTSGYREEVGDPSFVHASYADWVEDWAAQVPTGTLGEFHYTDFGFAAAGYIVQKVSGLPIDDFIQERIIAPLRLANTSTGASDRPAWRARVNPWYAWNAEAGVYHLRWSHHKPADPFYHAASGMFSTAMDYAAFMSMWLNRGTWQGVQLVSPAAAEAALAEHGRDGWFGYGYGWVVEPEPVHDGMPAAFGHGGGDGTIAMAFPALNAMVVLLTHSRSGPHRDALLEALAMLEIFDHPGYGRVRPDGAEAGRVALARDARQGYVGTYMDREDAPRWVAHVHDDGATLQLRITRPAGHASWMWAHLAPLGDGRFGYATYDGTRLRAIHTTRRVEFSVEGGRATALRIVSGTDTLLRARRTDADRMLAGAAMRRKQVPAANLLAAWLNDEGIERAREHFNDLRASGPDSVRFNEIELAMLAYRLLHEEARVAEAIAVFEMIAAAFLDSPYAWDDLGDGYRTADRLEDARRSYARAVDLAERQQHANLPGFRRKLEWVARELLTPALARAQSGAADAAAPSLDGRIDMMFRYMEIPSRIRGLDLVEPHWLADGNRFWFASGAPGETVIYIVDPMANTQSELFDRDRLRRALTARLGHEPPGRGIPFDDFSFVSDRNDAVRFSVDGEQFTLDLTSYTVEPAAEEEVARPTGLAPGGRWYRDIVGSWFNGRIEGVPSPDGKWMLVEEGHNLSLRSAVDSSRVRLTSDGTAEHPWRLQHPRGAWGGPPFLAHWSPDGTRIAAYRSDSRNVPRHPVVHWKRPFGDTLHERYRVQALAEVEWKLAASAPVELHVGELGTEGVRWVKVADEAIHDGGKTQAGSFDDAIGGFRWRANGSELWFTRERDWGSRLELLATDPRTGSTRIVLTETAETFVDHTQNERYDLLHFLEDGERFIWRSNRDGWYDLYLYDVDGTLVRRLTEGDFEVTWPFAIDEDTGWIYFGVYGEAPRPYETYIHRVRLDGSGFQRLTERNGQPGPFGFSPSREFFLLYSSTPTSPEVVELWRADGTRLRTLATDDVDWLVDELRWTPPEEFVVKAADGETDLHGLLFKPWDFDPQKRYPVVQVVYGNPSFNTHTFSPWFMSLFGSGNRDAPALAQLGFITFVVEERGTHGRGRAFRDVVYRDVAEPKVADHVATLRQLAAARPYMDLSRVGVVGGSYGGIATIRNMLLAPDVYHVGVARSSRWFKWEYRVYGAPYHEIPEIYERNSSLTYVDNLKGNVLLAQATDDDIEEVMILIEALTDAGRFYDLMILPRGGHSLTESHPRYFHEAQARYLVTHLNP